MYAICLLGIQSKWHDNEIQKKKVIAIKRFSSMRFRYSKIDGRLFRKRTINVKMDVSGIGYRSMYNRFYITYCSYLLHYIYCSLVKYKVNL